jgi:lipoate-protein ligase A
LPLPAVVDVEPFRSEPRRVVLTRHVTRPTIVLGSTQREEVVDDRARRSRGVEVVRRRGGGGAVYLGPGSRSQLWVDAWIPRPDPLWSPDVSAAAEWVGAWWISALGPCPGSQALGVHRGRAVADALGDVVCFAGRGPGEVVLGARKLVGVSQWRCREGALLSSCAYAHWDADPLLELIAPAQWEGRGGSAVGKRLRSCALGLADLAGGLDDLAVVGERLVASFNGFDGFDGFVDEGDAAD